MKNTRVELANEMSNSAEQMSTGDQGAMAEQKTTRDKGGYGRTKTWAVLLVMSLWMASMSVTWRSGRRCLGTSSSRP